MSIRPRSKKDGPYLLLHQPKPQPGEITKAWDIAPCIVDVTYKASFRKGQALFAFTPTQAPTGRNQSASGIARCNIVKRNL